MKKKVDGYYWEDYLEFLAREREEEFPEKELTVGETSILVKARNYKGKEIVQLPVLSQIEMHDGAATCGYHTVGNGALITLALCGEDVPVKVKEFLQCYTEKQLSEGRWTHLNDFFHTKFFFEIIFSLWKEKVILERTVDLLKLTLSRLWTQCVRIPEIVAEQDGSLKKQKVAEFYSTALSEFATAVAREVVINDQDFSFHQGSDRKKLHLLFNRSCRKKKQEDINGYFTLRPGTKKMDDLFMYLNEKSRLANYVDLEKLKNISVSPGNYRTLIEENKKDLENGRGLGRRSDENGGWLDGHEIEMLISFEKKDLLKNIKHVVSWLVYGDTSLIGKAFDGNKEKLEEAARKIIADPHHKVIFCIGTMANGTNNMTGSLGHWFPLVFSRDRYYVMDSLGKCRLNDERVQKVIDTFESCKALKIFSQGTMERSWGKNNKTGLTHILQRAGMLSKTICFPSNNVSGSVRALQHAGLLSKVTH